MSDLVLHSHLFQQSRLFNIVTNSVVYLVSQPYLLQQPKHIQKFHKLILSYPIAKSNLIKQSHILNSVTNSIVWSRLHYHLFQQSRLFNIVTNSVVYLVSQSYLFQQSKHIQKFHKLSCIIQFHSLISFNSPTY